MDNRDIFQFDFVDRKKQEIIVNNFLADSSEENFLWIDGESGIGKSYFVENRINNHVDNFEHINICLSSQTDNINCINEIISELQCHLNTDFANFIRSNYQALLDFGRKNISKYIKLNDIKLEVFFELLFNSNFAFKDNSNNTISAVKVIQNYIDNILRKNKILLILDNFTNCDIKSLKLLNTLLTSYVNDIRIKCIFITTSSILENRKDIQVFLTESLPIQRMYLNELEKANYFFSILDNIFEINDEIHRSIDSIYNICKGNPETLKSLIRKIYLCNGITIPNNNNSKAIIDSKLLNKYLVEKSFDIDSNDLNEDECFVIQVLLGFGTPVKLSILQSCILYIHERFFLGSLWTNLIVNNILTSLQRKNILSCEDVVKFVHDRIYMGLNLLLKNDLNRSYISLYFYEFLNATKNVNINIDIEYLLAYHSYIAEIIGWSEINYRYGFKKYKEKKYADAVTIFNRLFNRHIELKSCQKLVICEALYEIGAYETAKTILNQSSFNFETRRENYKYYCLFGKIENVLLNKNIAIQKYNKAINYASNREDELQILNLKHLALLETPNGKKEAKQIFDDIALNLTNEEKKMMPICNLLRNCNQFYTGKKADAFFELAKEIAIQNNALVDVAYVNNNYALELFRTGNKRKAFEKFELSYKTLRDLKYHEAAYPLNNMAVCEMFKNNYSDALDYLLEAKYVNQSLYADLAIKVHMMTCYRELKNEKNCRKYAKKLEDYLFYQKIYDYNIIRKLSINLCITHMYYEEIILAKTCLAKGLPYFKGTISEYRGCSLDNRINCTCHTMEHALKKNDYYTTLKFEPWIITLSHD